MLLTFCGPSRTPAVSRPAIRGGCVSISLTDAEFSYNSTWTQGGGVRRVGVEVMEVQAVAQDTARTLPVYGKSVEQARMLRLGISTETT